MLQYNNQHVDEFDKMKQLSSLVTLFELLFKNTLI